jgi:hypothetical protein
MDWKELSDELKTSEGVFNILPWTIRKVGKYNIDVPLELTATSDKFTTGYMKDLKEGIYLWIFPCGLVRKVGLFGEGVGSDFNSRYSAYRSAAKNIWENEGEYIVPSGRSNGSAAPIKCILDKLKVGEEVKIAVMEVQTITTEVLIEGYKRPMTINKALIEDNIKKIIENKNPNQLYLS